MGKNTKFIWVVAAAFVLVGGFLFFVNYSFFDNSVTTNDESNNGMHFDAYHNAALGISLIAPINWHIRTSADSVRDVTYATDGISIENTPKPYFWSTGMGPYNENEVSLEGTAIRITRAPFTSASLEEHLKKNYPNASWTSHRTILNPNVIATEVNFADAGVYMKDYFITRSGYVYEIGVTGSQGLYSNETRDIVTSIGFD